MRAKSNVRRCVNMRRPESKIDEFKAVLDRFIDTAMRYESANKAWEDLMAAREQIKREIANAVTPEGYVQKRLELKKLEQQQAEIDRPLHDYHNAKEELKAWFSGVDRATIVIPDKRVKVEYNNGLLTLSDLPDQPSKEEADGSKGTGI
jgi:seryl-tRNA synthetase